MLNRSIVLSSVLFVLLSGCATYSKMLVNSNRQLVRCAYTGQGVLGMSVASNAYSKCKSDYKLAGYMEIEEAGVSGIDTIGEEGKTLKILRIMNNSSASRAGISAGDILLAIDGQKVIHKVDAFRLLFGKVGTNVVVTVVKDGKENVLPLPRPRFIYKDIWAPGSPKFGGQSQIALSSGHA